MIRAAAAGSGVDIAIEGSADAGVPTSGSRRGTHGRWILIAPTPRSAKLVTELLSSRIAAANAELAQFSDAEFRAIRRFLLASTERHNRSAATLRALPPVRAAL